MNILEQIEKIVKEAPTYLTEGEIYNCLKGRDIFVTCRLFITCMDILEAMGKVVINENELGGNEVYWVGVDNPKLEKLLKESVLIK